jgi:hypothetical protein
MIEHYCRRADPTSLCYIGSTLRIDPNFRRNRHAPRKGGVFALAAGSVGP